MKKILKMIIATVVLLLILAIGFQIGKYSWLISKPRLFCDNFEQWAIDTAKAAAFKHGIGKDRLVKPRH